MQRIEARFLLWVPVALAACAGLWLWGFGGAARVGQIAAQNQHWVQNAMAAALRQLKAGDHTALMALWGLCFAYGFFHAAGPGHGKLVIGGYGLGRRVPMGRLAGLAVASSLAQAGTAVILVYAGVLALGWSRQQMQGLADTLLSHLSNAAVAGIGLWLVWRGLRGFWRLRRTRPAPLANAVPDLSGLGQPLDHVHDESCGHLHGPTVQQAAGVRSLRDAAMIIGAIALRPCTGALFLLILTWRIGIDWAGIIGAFVMGLGTASITLLVAIASVCLRESALAQAASGRGTARTLALAEVLAGTLVLALALQLLFHGVMGWT